MCVRHAAAPRGARLHFLPTLFVILIFAAAAVGQPPGKLPAPPAKGSKAGPTDAPINWPKTGQSTAGPLTPGLPGLPGAPGAPKSLSAQADEAGWPDWLTYTLIGLGVLVVVVIAAVAAQQSNAGKKKKKLVVTDEQIGGYRFANLMWTGNTTQVWEVSEITSGRHFAIKMLLPEHAHKAQERQMLFHEAEVAQRFTHPNVVRVISIVRDKDHPHVVMDFFPGGNLKLRILHKETDFIKEKAHDILKQAATALSFVNMKGWVHRDVKPENILVNAAGDVRLIDFAIAQEIPKGLAKKFHNRRSATQGTRSYMSPEQIRNEPLDGRADIYSFGATAYELVTGRPPFRAANQQDLLVKHLTDKAMSPQIHNPEVTDGFAALVLKMLEKDRNKRPESFHTVLQELKKVRVFRADAGKGKGAVQGR